MPPVGSLVALPHGFSRWSLGVLLEPTQKLKHEKYQ